MSALVGAYEHLDTRNYGMHSVRSGAALAMDLSGMAVVDTMLQGRWGSETFLLYTKRQVLGRSAGIYSDMVRINKFDRIPPTKHQAMLDRSKKLLQHRGSSRT